MLYSKILTIIPPRPLQKKYKGQNVILMFLEVME